MRVLSSGFFFLLVVLYCCVSTCVAFQEVRDEDKVAVNVGVLYDEDKYIGKMGLKCIQMALSDFYNSHEHYKTRIVLHNRSYTKDDIVGAASAALYLLKYAEVKAIIGLTTSTEAEFVIQLGERAQVPILSYSATSPSLSFIQSSYFIRVAQNDLFQTKAISALVKVFHWQEVVLLYVDNDYGAGIIPYLDDALQKVGVRIPSHEAIPLTATDDQILQLLYKLKALPTRVFLLHLSLELAGRLFLCVNELNMMSEGYAWITTTGISNGLGSLEHSVIESMQGVIGVKTYVPETNELQRFRNRWDREFRDKKLDVTGLWAYDAACALARALEEIAAPHTGFKKNKLSANLTDIDALGVSPSGPELLKALLNASFNGLAGVFNLTDRQLESSTFNIINVLDVGSREVGIWTPELGLGRSFNSKGNTPPPSADLRPIIWPGEVISVPKGWDILAGGQKLRVGVPVKAVYEQLVNVSEGKLTGSLKPAIVTGFCIDIFEAVMEKLGLSNRYEYYPFSKSDGTPNGSYNDLVYQVFLQNYDVVVGDITILANRSSYIDFTLPYTESGVTMVVPVRNDKRSAWVFLKPLTWDLWVASLCAFIFIAFTIWVLEHHTNKEFQGSPSHQAGTSLFYSFSMMVFAQRENVLSNLTRLVVIIWIFVVFVLTQSYTASLTSMLTVQQLQPSVTGIEQLLSTGASVGIQDGSFVKELLLHKGFRESKIVSYNTSDQLDSLLSKGSTNGGIAAVFDEIPYMKLFLAIYPSKYLMVEPIYKTDGFGFAFPRGSLLAPEVSRKILEVTEGDNIYTYEKEWGMQLFNSSEQSNKVTSGSLSLDSFWGLFLIVGVATGFALAIFTVTFLHKHRHICYSDAPIRSKIRRLAQAFKSPDIDAHTSMKSEGLSIRHVEADHANINGSDVHGITQNSENTSHPSRPSSYSDQSEENLAFSVGTSPSPDRSSHPTLQE